MRYLITINNIPNNIILADDEAIANHIATLNGGTARLLVDNETVEFPEPEPIREVQLTKLQFLRRFTAEERIAIRASANPVIVDFMSLLDLAQDVQLDDPDTVAGVHYLETLTLISVGRAAEILGE